MKNKRREFIKEAARVGIGMTGLSTMSQKLFASHENQKFDLFMESDREGTYHSVKIITSTPPQLLTAKAINIFKRLLHQKTGRDFFKPSNKQLIIKLVITPGFLPAESFEVEGSKDTISITAPDENGILYGLGKLLHTSSFSYSGYTPGDWRGKSIPDKPFRATYFATHFHNFYQNAPIEEVINYLEELSLWGINGLQVWFDMHSYDGIADPKAQVMLDRLSKILQAGKSVGMKAGIIMLANEGYKNSPKDLRANPYTSNGFNYHVESCPRLPGAPELLLKQFGEEVDAFSQRGVTLDRVCLWPYDQGGCGCILCEPWGSNGFLYISKKISSLLRTKLPNVEIILSTWLFDYGKDLGEWSGLAKAFREEKPFVDYIMADSHTSYPKYPLNHPVPGGLPLLNFPEISMFGSWPWGAYGANPLPERFQRLWDVVADKVDGGFPYSEGIFDDINMVIYSQFYWDRHKSANETLKEYVSFEFSHELADEIIGVIGILEKDWGFSSRKWAAIPGVRQAIDVSSKDFGAKKAYKTMREVDEQLPDKIKSEWRWRLLLLRSMLDYELRLTNGVINKEAEAGFEEICKIQHLEHGDWYVKPPINYGALYPIKGGEHGRPPCR